MHGMNDAAAFAEKCAHGQHAIRDRKLYREQHQTFEAYCEERWELEKKSAYRLMAAADFAEKVSHWTLSIPSRESHIRPLITRHIKELQPSVSNRQIARTLGVSDQTINNDVGAKSLARHAGSASFNNSLEKESANNLAPPLTGREAAVAVNRRERVYDGDMSCMH